MTLASPPGCVRCGTILAPTYRFCPECGLPVSGGVLSTEIGDVRRRVESETEPERSGWRRYLLPTLATISFAFVLGLGLVLFNRPLLNRLLPPAETHVAVEPAPKAPRWEPEWVAIKPGRFPLGGDEFAADEPSKTPLGEIRRPYEMSKYEITNELWLQYLNAEWQRLDETLWYESFPRNVPGWSGERGSVHVKPEFRNYPVTNVSPVAIAEFCVYLTHRLDKAGFEIRMPSRFEWQYAASGPKGRTYPWGDDDVLVPIPRTGSDRPRAGIHSVLFKVSDFQLAEDDTSPFGVVGMGTNVSEWVLLPDKSDRQAGDPEREVMDFSVADVGPALAEGRLQVVWCGASRSCNPESARRLARVWNYKSSEARNADLDIGIRLVKVQK